MKKAKLKAKIAKQKPWVAIGKAAKEFINAEETCGPLNSALEYNKLRSLVGELEELGK